MASYNNKKRFTPLNFKEEDITYTNVELLSKFVAEGARIIPARISGMSSRQQRLICKAIKNARFLALMPYCPMHK